MPYIQLSNPDFPLSEMDLQLLASQQEPPVTIEKYIEENNIQFVEGEEFDNNGVVKKIEDIDKEVDIIENFQPGAAQPSATAVPTNPTALENINTELLAEDISLDSVIQDQRPLDYVDVDEAQAEYDELEKQYPNLMDRRKWWGGINDDVYMDGYAEREAARVKLEKANTALRNSTINVNIPETFIGDNIENIQKAFENPITGFGDVATFQSNENKVGAQNESVLTATLNNGDVLELPMNYESFFRGSDKQKRIFEQNYQKLKDYQLSLIKANDIVDVVTNIIDPSQVSSLVESVDEGNLSLTALNKELKAINYEVKPIYDNDKRIVGITDDDTELEKQQKQIGAAVNNGENKIIGYQLLKNGRPFNLLSTAKFDNTTQSFNPLVEKESFNLDAVQTYLRNNLTTEETNIVKESLVNTYNDWIQIQQAKKVELEKKISKDNNGEVVRQYIKDKTFAKKVSGYLKLLNQSNSEVNFSEEEILHIEAYFNKRTNYANDKVFRDKTLQLNSKYANQLEFVLDTSHLELATSNPYATVEENLDYYSNKEGLKYPGLIEKLQALDIKGLVKNSLVGSDGNGGLRRSIIDKRFDTMHESAIKEIGDDEQTIIDTGMLLSKTENALQDKSLVYKAQKLKVASELLEKIPKLGIVAVDEKVKNIKGIEYNFQNIEGQGSFYSISASADLSDEDQAKFDEARAMLFKIQNTLINLQEDKKETIDNFKNQIVNLKYKEALNESEKNERTKVEINSLLSTINDDTGKQYTLKEATDYIKKRDSQQINMYDAFAKEYGTAELMAKDFGDATYGIFLALPTLTGSQWAIDEQVRLNQKNEVYMTMGELGDGSGNKGLFALRTLSQQFPNILMAIGTGSVGNALKLSDAMVKTTIATTFGVTSGADTYRRLTVQTDLVDQAKKQQVWLKGAYKEGLIDQSTYANGMADAAQTIAFNNMSDTQILGASFMTGVVEGTVTRYIGSANNTVKILKDIRGYPTISQTALANKNTLLGKYGLYGMEYGKRVGGELIEESTILLGTQGLSEFAILDRDFNLDQLDDVWFSTLLTAGFSNGPSLAYSAVVNVSVSQEMKKQASEQYNKIKILRESLLNENLKDSEVKAINNEIQERTEGLGEMNGEAAVDAQALGGNKLKKLFHFKQIKDGLLRRAGVDANTDPSKINYILGQYKRRKLTSDEKSNFEKELSSIESSINEIRNSDKDYESVKDMLNDNDPTFGMYAATEKRLKQNPTDQWKRAKTPRQKIAAVISYLNSEVTSENTEKARKDPKVEEKWQEQVKIYTLMGMPVPDKEKWLINEGRLLGRQTTTAITVATESSQAADILNEKSLNDLTLIQKPEGSDLLVELESMYKNKEITVVEYENLKNELKANPTSEGFIVNNKFIINAVGDIKERIKANDYRASIVVLHEINHAQDDRFFGNTTDGLSARGKDYAENFRKALLESSNVDLKSIGDQASSIVKQLYNEFNKDGTINDTYLDEWTKEAQSLLFAFEGDLQLETAEQSFGTLDNIIDKVFGGSRYNINTPQKALAYALGSNAAARQGKMSEFVKRGIELQNKGAIVENLSTKASRSLNTLQTINNKNANVENFKPITQEQFDSTIGKVASRTWSRFGRPIPENIREKFIGSLNDRTGRKKWIADAEQILNTIALNFDASKATFGSYIANTGMQRANSWAKNEFGIPSVSQGTRVGIESEQVQSKADATTDLKSRAKKESKESIPSIKENIKFKDKKSLDNKILKGVAKEVKYKLPKISDNKTFKSKSNLIQAITKGLLTTTVDGKNLYAQVIDEMGGRNKTLPTYEQFLNENYETLLSSGGLTTTYLLKAFPQAVQKYVNGMGWVNYDTWKGRTKGTKEGQVDFYRTGDGPYQGSTSGMQKTRRVPNIKNVIPLSQFKGKYIDGINNKVKVAPTEALAKQLLQEIGIQTFAAEINKETSSIKDTFVERQQLLNQLANVYNLEAEVTLETERRGIKNSLALLEPSKFDLWESKKQTFFDEILKAKDYKSKTILNIHKGVYGTEFENEHKDIALQFSKLLIPVDKADGIVFKTNDEFVNYLEDIVLAGDVNQTIVQFTGASIVNSDGVTVPYRISEMTRDLNSVSEARDFVSKVFVPKLIKSFGKEKALDMLVAYAGTTFSQGQTKFGSFEFKNGGLQRHNDASNRTGLFGKQDVDILQNLIQPNFKNVKSIANQTITFNDGTKSRKIEINRSADVQQSMLGDKFKWNESKTDAAIAKDFTKSLMESLPSKGTNDNLTALILATINSSSNSALRLAAPVWGKSATMPYDKIKRPRLATAKDVKDKKAKKIGDKMYTKKGNLMMESNYRFEHAVPARVVLWYLYDSYVNKNKSIDLDLLFDDYRVTIIPITEMDDVITKTGFSSIMLASYKPGDQTWWKRYFNRFTKGKIPYALESYETGDKIGEDFQAYYDSKNPVVFKPNSGEQVLKDNNANEAMKKARSAKYSKKIKKIRVFDFDDTLAKSNSKVLYTMPDGTKGKLSATEFARDAAKMERQGVEWNFEEFNKVVEGRKGPLFNVAKTIQDQRGSEDIFVLTARPQEAAIPIQEFLASIGLNIPLANITGLENGNPKAKADWMVNKFAEGYNDFYFTDDATKNVKAVKEVLDVLDVKSKVQIARAKFSQKLDTEFNLMLEQNKGIDANKRYSQVVAQRLGKNKKRWNFFIPPSADDFRGLTMYMFSGKGKKGEADMEWFNKALIKPYTQGVNAIEKARQQVSNDFAGLVKGFPKIKKLLRSKITDQQYTYDEAIRVYLWEKAGFTIPGLSKRDQNMLSKTVREDANLSSFAEGVLAVSKKETYVEPSEFWSGGTILSDLNSLTTKINRKEFIAEFIENVDIIFNEDNLRKIEANYGTRVREALVDSIYRMKTGENKTSKSKDSAIVNKWNNWVNNSIGAIMFFNRKSALLQLISNVNFINWSDNNPAMAAAAFANQPQYWKDVVRLFNSDKLKQRRAGLKSDVNEAEIAAAVKGSKNKMQTAISILLKYGFTPTQIADSLAISTGGATFYRNRINTYKKQGLTDVEAEQKAFIDFSEVSDESQQSADPMLISSQQAGVLGRLILAFQNTPMQYTRLMKKAGLDLINGRGDAKTNISKIVYYGFIQNLIFSTLQNALFAMIPGFNEDDEETEETMSVQLDRKKTRIANGMIDTILRGSGVAGAAISTIKNAYMKYISEEEKGFLADHTYTILELANLSPPIGSKLRKVYSGIQTSKKKKDVIAERGFDVTIDGKFNLGASYEVTGDLVSGVFNLPVDRLVAEINALTEALDDRNTKWQRLALAMGYRTWDVNAKNEEHDRIKSEGKARRKIEGIEKGKKTRAENKRIKDSIYNSLSPAEKDKIMFEKLDTSIEKMFKKLDEI